MLHYRELGSGKPVILLHGFPLSSQIWEPVAQRLAQTYRVIMPDLPGHGASNTARGAAASTMELIAGEVLYLMGRLGLEQAAVAGHSMGGYAALALARIAPHRLSGLALVTTQARGDTPEGKQGRYDLAEKVGQGGSAVVATAMAPKLFAESVHPDSPLYEQADAMMRATPAEGIQAALRGMAERADSREMLGKITVPTLILAGQQDRVIPADRSEEMAAAIPGSRLVVIEGAGHMPMLERPEQTAGALASWLAAIG